MKSPPMSQTFGKVTTGNCVIVKRAIFFFRAIILQQRNVCVTIKVSNELIIQLVSDVFTHSSLWEIGYNSMMDCDNLIISFADETIDV